MRFSASMAWRLTRYHVASHRQGGRAHAHGAAPSIGRCAGRGRVGEEAGARTSNKEGGGRGPAADQGARPRRAVRGVPLRGARFVCGVLSFYGLPRRRRDDAGMEPTYAHTCVKGIKLAAGELSDSTEEEEVEAMEMYARLAEAEDPRDFEQTLQEARKRALQEENEIQQSIETLEELAREHVNDSLAVMEYRYELRQMSKFGFLSGLISAPRAHVERNVAKAVLQGSPKNLRTALMVLSTFPPVRYSVSSTLMPSS